MFQSSCVYVSRCWGAVTAGDVNFGPEFWSDITSIRGRCWANRGRYWNHSSFHSVSWPSCQSDSDLFWFQVQVLTPPKKKTLMSLCWLLGPVKRKLRLTHPMRRKIQELALPPLVLMDQWKEILLTPTSMDTALEWALLLIKSVLLLTHLWYLCLAAFHQVIWPPVGQPRPLLVLLTNHKSLWNRRNRGTHVQTQTHTSFSVCIVCSCESFLVYRCIFRSSHRLYSLFNNVVLFARTVSSCFQEFLLQNSRIQVHFPRMWLIFLYCTEKELQSLKGWLCCRAATIRVSRKKGGSGSSTPQTPQSAVVRSSWLDVWKGFRWHYQHHHHYCFSDLLLLSQSFITNLNKILVELKLSVG